ncbi:class I SAM-dependent methyltransferase [Porticoccaceae bacterium]|nr:class I SAM-dependent methyltransferase [Porticoccaceae bacterium]
MGQEIDLMANYPRPKRNVEERGATKTDADRALARKFGEEFFDGDRTHGYGGFNYQPRFWQPVIPTFKAHWGLTSDSSILDVGCAKGFMMHDFAELIPGITVKGIDVSEYAVKNSIEDMRPHVDVADAKSLPYEDKSFDYVISVTTIHNLERAELVQSLREIERVARLGSFITVDAYRNDEEKERMLAWNLTAKTVLHVDEWKELFKEAGYSGDYHWFMP